MKATSQVQHEHLTVALLLEHHAIMMRGLHLDLLAVAYLEQAAQTVEQEMNEQEATFPDLLNTAVLEVPRPVSFCSVD